MPFRFRSKHSRLAACTVFAFLVSAICSNAETITLGASKDNTIYEEGELTDGGGHHIFAGKTGSLADMAIRRALIAFDIAGALPADSTITGVTLTLHLTRGRIFGPTTEASLFPLMADWGEGTVKASGPEGVGNPAAVGDATWTQRFFGGGNTTWSVPGGDFRPTASATTEIGFLSDETPVLYTWTGSGLVSDVQSWLDSPQTNFGWMLRNDEAIIRGAKRFASSENPDFAIRPALAITYVPEPAAAGLLGAGALLLLRRRGMR